MNTVFGDTFYLLATVSPVHSSCPYSLTAASTSRSEQPRKALRK